jgi:hypothetical protein
MLTNKKTLDNVELRKVDSLTARRQLAQSEHKVRGLKGSGKGSSSSNAAFFIEVDDDKDLAIELLNGTFEKVEGDSGYDDDFVCFGSNCVGEDYSALVSGEVEYGCDVLVLAVGSLDTGETGNFMMSCANVFDTLTADILLCDDSDVTASNKSSKSVDCKSDIPLTESDGQFKYKPLADDFNYMLEFKCCPST